MSIEKKVIETLVPEKVYTDREDHIEYFYNAALKAITRRTMSTVLLGQRRMGKTEIFKRVVNRLFFDQHHDDQVVIPVYFQFPDENITRDEFAMRYVDNFLRWVAAFRLKDKSLIYQPQNTVDLLNFIENNLNMSKGLEVAIGTARSIMSQQLVLASQAAIMLPKKEAY